MIKFAAISFLQLVLLSHSNISLSNELSLGAAMANYWVYVVGPILGALVAARLYEAIRGSEKHAQGAPNDLYQALHDIELKG